jgi:hypothetical protein
LDVSFIFDFEKNQIKNFAFLSERVIEREIEGESKREKRKKNDFFKASSFRIPFGLALMHTFLI